MQQLFENAQKHKSRGAVPTDGMIMVSQQDLMAMISVKNRIDQNLFSYDRHYSQYVTNI